MALETLHYDVFLHNPEEHIYRVRLTVTHAQQKEYVLAMAAWIPGSYMIRDFARNIMSISAMAKGNGLDLNPLDKQRWSLESANDQFVIEYDIYAWDCSVRTAHFDNTHAYFNGTSLFIKMVGLEHASVTLEIHPPEKAYASDWRVATSMQAEKKWAFGLYHADNFTDLIDHPFEIGQFDVASFTVDNVPHDVVISGAYTADCEKITADLSKICSTHIKMFGEMPADRYLFLIWVVDKGYGGLEHKYSTSLIVSRDDMIEFDNGEQTAAYRQFLGLCSHEYFHLWNVKRIRPGVYAQADLSQEVYTELLWVFEGFTSYFDDLALLRSGCITDKQYLQLLAETITRVEKGKGRLKQSVAESSFYTWTKFYKQDENATNAIVSYYAKGTLIALCLDLYIRENSEYCLDDVMRYMWVHHGATDIGIGEQQMPVILNAVTDLDFDAFIDAYVQGTKPLPLLDLLATKGISLQFDCARKKDDKGAFCEKEGSTKQNYIDLGANYRCIDAGLEILTVSSGSSAALAGLAKGDVLIAVDGRKISETLISGLHKYYQYGNTVTVTYFRDNYLFTSSVMLQPMPEYCARLSMHDVNSKRDAWLR